MLVHDQGLDRLPDTAILERAQLGSRILLTAELDFADLMAASVAGLPNVIVFRLRHMRPESVGGYLQSHEARGPRAVSSPSS